VCDIRKQGAEVMTTELYYFTGTGNGLHVAKSIKKSLEAISQETKLIPINTLNLSNVIYSNADRVGVIYPTYAVTAPAIVKSFAKQLRVSPNAYTFLYAHSGSGSTGVAIPVIENILAQNDVRVSNVFGTHFPSNSAVMTYTPEKLSSTLSKAEESVQLNLTSIMDMVSREMPKPNRLKGISYQIVESLGAATENALGFKIIQANDDCVGCSLCSKVCPKANIEMKDSKPVFEKKCEMCFSCINNCPKKSLAFKKMNRKKLLSYRHPEVTVTELMYR